MANELDPFRGFPTEVRDLFGASRSLNRLFDDFFERMPGSAQSGRIGGRSPKCELQDTEDHYVLCVEMPGVPKENINVELRGNSLYISGERRADLKGNKGEPTGQEYERFE